jgi:hypothetical protein
MKLTVALLLIAAISHLAQGQQALPRGREERGQAAALPQLRTAESAATRFGGSIEHRAAVETSKPSFDLGSTVYYYYAEGKGKGGYDASYYASGKGKGKGGYDASYYASGKGKGKGGYDASYYESGKGKGKGGYDASYYESGKGKGKGKGGGSKSKGEERIREDHMKGKCDNFFSHIVCLSCRER